MNDRLQCASCGSDGTEVIVQFGSYCIRCATCGEGIVATSFLAVSNTDREISAFVDPGHGKQPAPGSLIACGSFRQIAKAIRDVADTGILVRLVAKP
ncbi:hypothetical protein [Mesorhizobium huakuii]|uniref:Uncharacterized protein n=1 Tax=Mesorhizobium huakuii TaxID=28104 RepID=A0ABZ0VVS5_9HYPH|nr:hypothetical protein [Mesorhizobium huakuii]WQC00466.1 hypothetical protein U0R22_004672 [Mesorhizobium huakuii]